MSKTMTRDAIWHDQSRCMARRQAVPVRNAVSRATLDDHCDHANKNHNGTRCLSCGVALQDMVLL